MSKPFYITTTLPYVNAPLHMGHALEFVRTDTIARYKKLQGFDVFFNTGTDEHGQKIYTKALEAGKDPQTFVDANFETFKSQVASFGISPDAHYIRTTDAHHVSAAQEFWKRVYDNGYIYKKNYEAKYCIGCELEKTDSDLVNGECPEHPGIPLEIINEENYFFKYSAFQEKLTEFYNSRPNFVIPDFRFNETKAFLNRGLEDFSISRLKEKMEWGIPVPGDEKHVMYVWFDALTNYISTLGWPEDTVTFEKYWKDGTPTQYCGKDNNRFQSIVWQAMLMAANIPNSHQIIINGHITAYGGVKMSKSLGNGVDPRDIAREYGTDALRMFLLKEISSFEDSPFTIERFRDSYNADLANGLGNLTSRILTLSEKYIEPVTVFTDMGSNFTDLLNGFDLQRAMQIVWHEIGQLDKHIQESKPFTIIKTDEATGKSLIKGCVERLGMIATALTPFMPTTSEKILALIKENKKPETPLFQRLS